MDTNPVVGCMEKTRNTELLLLLVSKSTPILLRENTDKVNKSIILVIPNLSVMVLGILARGMFWAVYSKIACIKLRTKVNLLCIKEFLLFTNDF